jgi:uncharacterized protein
MRILMTGATGLIGRELGKVLVARGDVLVCLTRNPGAARRRLPFPALCVAWNHSLEVPPESLRGVDAVVNLAGEPLADSPWTPAKKALIRESRVQGTRQLVRAVLGGGEPVRAFVQGSAIGFHGERGNDLMTATSPRGTGFLADVVHAWEAETAPLSAARPDLRVPVVRTGVVLAREAGALAQLLPIFRVSAGGRLGNGEQWLSWIHLDDIVRLFVHALDSAATGVLEGVAPHAVTNRQFTGALCRSLGAIESVPVPPLLIRTLYGERAAVVLGSTRVAPAATQASGFHFKFDSIEAALDDLVGSQRGGVWERRWEQWLPQDAGTIWPFFGDAGNLAQITPPELAFRVVGQSTSSLQAGSLIDYRLKLNGLPIGWQTRIEVWDPPRRFVDVQLKGPYALWEHTHDFLPLGTGTLMRDTLRYRLPGGWLGLAAGGHKVTADLDRIFRFRSQIIDQRFGG